jgi:hypothetical protein
MLRTRSNRPNKKLEAALDALWSHLVKLAAGNKCVRCGDTYRLQAHHVAKRRFTATRWLIANGRCLCEFHHNKAERGLLKFPEQEQLQAKANVVTPRTMDFMDQAMFGLQHYLQALQKKR